MERYKKQVYSLYRVDNTKQSEIKGYWQNSEGKLSIDNIHIQLISIYELCKVKHRIFKEGEKSIFYTNKNNAFIEYNNKKPLEILTQKILIKQKSISEGHIKDLLNKYSGFTLFKDLEGYIIEIWSK